MPAKDKQKEKAENLKSEVDKIKAEKLRAIKAAFTAIDKATKKSNTAYFMGDRPVEHVKSFPTGSIMFDMALGVGGIPVGRILEVYGEESSGKTLTMLKAAGECQRKGGIVAFVDMEQTFDASWASKLGVNVQELIVSQPDTMEDAFNVIDGLIDSEAVDFIILDSVASLVPQAELEEDIGKQSIALVARGMSKFLRRITPRCNKSGCTIAFINQTRSNIGIMFGNPITTGGGKI